MATVLRITGETKQAVASADAVTLAIKEIQAAQGQAAAASREAAIAQVNAARLVEEAQATLAATTVEGGQAVVAQTALKVRALQEEIVVANQVTASYKAGSIEQSIAIERVNRLIMSQTALLGRNAAVGATSAAAGAAGAAGGSFKTAEAGFARGVLSHASGVGGWIAGPGFILGAAATIGMKEASDALRDIQDEMEQLQVAVKNTGNSWKAYQGVIKEVVENNEDLGVKQSETLRGMTGLIRVTGDVNKSQHLMKVAVDISKGAHIDMNKAVGLVIQAENGRFRGLQRLIGPIKTVTTHTDQLREAHIKVTDANRKELVELAHRAKAMDKQATINAAVATAEDKFAGAAVRHMKSAEGASDRRRVAIERLEVEIGQGLLPVERAFSEAIAKLADRLRTSTRLADGLREVGHNLRTIWTILSTLWGTKIVHDLALFTAALYTARKAQIALTVAARANPYVAVATAAVVATVLIITHWNKVKKFFEVLWKWISNGFEMMWDEVKILAYRAYLKILEPFSHLPGRMGKWARDAKDNVNTEIEKLQHDMHRRGDIVASAWGDAFKDRIRIVTAEAAAIINKGIPADSIEALQVASLGNQTTMQSQGTEAQKKIVAAGKKFGPDSGITYVWGGETPQAGFDCSGYVQFVYKKAGIKIPRTSSAQFNDPNALKVAKKDIEPGDALYFKTGGPGPPPQHVGLALGGPNDFFIEYYSGGKPAKYNQIATKGGFMGARRWLAVKSDKGGDTGGTTPGDSFADDLANVPRAPGKAAPKFEGMPTPGPGGGQVDKLAAKKKLRTMYGRTLVNYIATKAKGLGLDPAAVLAVASVEGGFQGKVGDNGTSFGPFQLHAGGALPNNVWKQGVLYCRAWANSPEGLDYALKKIAEVAGRESGEAAVRSIVTGFEHPAKPEAEVAKATGRLGQQPFTIGSLQGSDTIDKVKEELKARVEAAKALAELIKVSTSDFTKMTPRTVEDVFGDISTQRGAIEALGMTVKQALDVLSPVAQKAVATAQSKIKQIRDKIAAGVKSGLVSKAQLAAWRKQLLSLGETVDKAISEAAIRAQHAVSRGMDSIRRQFVKTTLPKILHGMGLPTLEEFDKETQGHLKDMQKQFQKSMQAFTEETQRGLARFVVKETPAEGALRAFQQQRAAQQKAQNMAQLQSDLAAAVAGGDPGAIAQAQKAIDEALLDQQEEDMQRAAEASREAQDAATQAQQEAYQKERDAQAEALQEQEQDRENAYQVERDAARTHIEEVIADETEKFEEDLDVWWAWLGQRAEALDAFYAWAKEKYGVGPGAQGGAFGRQIDEGLHDEILAGVGIGTSRIKQAQMGGTIRRPGSIRRADIVPVLAHDGETFLDEGLTQKLEAALQGGGIGGGLTIVVSGNTLLGRDREVARFIADKTEPEIQRRIGYRPTV